MKKADVFWTINPFKLAENGASTQRKLLVEQFARLADYLYDLKGEIAAKVEGFVDQDGRKLLKCELSGQVNLVCQSTFKAVPVEIKRELVFYPVMSEQAIADAPEEFEAFLFDTEELDLVELIEDELILSLPLAVTSDEAPMQFSFGPKIVEQSAVKPNPFAVLENLKQSSENSSN